MDSVPHNPVASIGQLFLDFMSTRHDLEQTQRALQIAEAKAAGLEGELLGARVQLEGMASELKRLTNLQAQPSTVAVEPDRIMWAGPRRVHSEDEPIEAAD